ncbi:phage major capsid protein [Gordonia sp. TBRC 11910]|uniref:Phage major capsid protein n=1 Tax=Gordonia asplenii TaxID=2725283 RepID=A0A848KXQ7_9ACTN|nr:phage major capsid protein [Gordonia asplenii]NMO03129.1 phage major capsid protein [Gordonia asplenii]
MPIVQRSSFSITESRDASLGIPGLLPPQLDPLVVGQIHEPRLLEKLPTMTIEAPSFEFIRHNSTTGGPGMVAEGAAKPEAVAATDRVIVTARKIAVHGAVTWEAIADFDAFESYWQAELFAQVFDVEAAQILTGDGTGQNLTGLNATSGHSDARRRHCRRRNLA